MSRATVRFLAACAAGCLLAEAAVAGGLSRWRAPESSYVVAESPFGNGTVAGPVRLVRTGYEVRMPGGTWIACRWSCSETLRVETVDFWENRRGAGRDAIDSECGILGCLTWSRRF